MGLVLSASLGRNLDIAVRQPTNRCTSLMFTGLGISMIALHFSGFASIPCCVSMKPKNFLLSMSKTHLLGFNRRLYLRRVVNTLGKSFECCRWLGDLTTMSSTYISTHLPNK